MTTACCGVATSHAFVTWGNLGAATPNGPLRSVAAEAPPLPSPGWSAVVQDTRLPGPRGDCPPWPGQAGERPQGPPARASKNRRAWGHGVTLPRNKEAASKWPTLLRSEWTWEPPQSSLRRPRPQQVRAERSAPGRSTASSAAWTSCKVTPASRAWWSCLGCNRPVWSARPAVPPPVTDGHIKETDGGDPLTLRCLGRAGELASSPGLGPRPGGGTACEAGPWHRAPRGSQCQSSSGQWWPGLQAGLAEQQRGAPRGAGRPGQGHSVPGFSSTASVTQLPPSHLRGHPSTRLGPRRAVSARAAHRASWLTGSLPAGGLIPAR